MIIYTDTQTPRLGPAPPCWESLDIPGHGCCSVPACVLPPLSSHPRASLPPTPLRMAGFDGSAWDEEEEEPPDHQYYNDFPGKEPPLGGVVDMRLREGATPGATRPTQPSAQPSTQLGATLVSGLDRGNWAPDRSGSLGPLVSSYFCPFSLWGSLLGETRKSASRCHLHHPAQVQRG